MSFELYASSTVHSKYGGIPGVRPQADLGSKKVPFESHHNIIITISYIYLDECGFFFSLVVYS